MGYGGAGGPDIPAWGHGGYIYEVVHFGADRRRTHAAIFPELRGFHHFLRLPKQHNPERKRAC